MSIDFSKTITAGEKAARAAAARKALLVSAIDAKVEEVARDRGYNSAATLASYVASTNETWAAEAAAFVAWRDRVWHDAYACLADVEAGTRAVPNVSEALAMMPQIAWPG